MKSDLRLLVISSYTGQGGIGRWLSLALPYLSKKMQILCLVKYGAAAMQSQFNQTDPGVRIREVPLQSPRQLFGVLAIFGALRTYRPHVVLAQDPFSMVGFALLRLLGLAGGSRLLVVVHSVATEFPHVHAWKRRLVFRVAASAWRQNDALIAVSGHVAEFVRKTPLRVFPVRVVPNGFQVTGLSVRGPPGAADAPLKVGYVGRFSIEKGADRLVPLIGALADCSIEWHVAGAGNLEPSVSKGLQPYVEAGKAIYHGWLTDPVSLIQKLDVLLIISRTEGCPFSVLEAHACGTLVVGLAVGGMPEVLDFGEAGVLLDDMEGLERCLRELSLHRGGHQRFLQRARALLETKYSWERMIETYSSQIHDVAAE